MVINGGNMDGDNAGLAILTGKMGHRVCVSAAHGHEQPWSIYLQIKCFGGAACVSEATR
jgi:hypothetical protein